MAKKNSGRSQKRRSERKVQDAFHLAERAERGSASESDTEDDDLHVRDGIMDARKFMKNAEDGGFEDEELDSDEAMASDDDFDVLSTKFSQTLRDKRKKHPKPQNGSSDLSSDDDSYHSVDESQFVTLSEAWAMDDRDLAASRGQKDVVLDDNWETEDSEDSSSASAESGAESESESESEDDEAMLRGSDADSDAELAATVRRISAAVKKPQHKKLVAETVAENEYSVPTRGSKLSVAEMMAAGDSAAAPLVPKGPGEAETAALKVPLPKHVQERNNRRAAYEIAKSDVARWQESVRTLQAADHVEFPLPGSKNDAENDENDEESALDRLQFVPAPTEKTELASKVDALLSQGALLDERNEATFEQLSSAKLSKEDLFKRTQELRRMRELMFRDEQRAARIKKIKSKQYRKIHKRERLRDAEMVKGEFGDDLGDDSGDDLDMKRAQERMSLRHKTQSKWARNVIRSGITKDASTRAELEEMLRAGERLRARQVGHADGEQSDEGISDLEREYAEENEEKNSKNSGNSEHENEENERSRLGKGVLAMDFMRAAEERQRKANRAELKFLREMEESGNPGDVNGEGLDSGDQFGDREKHSINQQKNQGRRVYAPSAAAARENLKEIEEDTLRDMRDDDEKSLVRRMGGDKHGGEGPVQKRARVEERENESGNESGEEFGNEGGNGSGNGFGEGSKGGSQKGNDGDSSRSSNPWLAETAPVKSKTFSTTTKDSSKTQKAAHKIAKHTKTKAPKSADTYIDLDHVMNIAKNSLHSEDEDDPDSAPMFRQHNLIQEAFAGDDVVSEFLAEKRQLEVDEDDKEEDVTLPGWGGWSGGDRKSKPKKKFVRKIDGVAQKDNRKDKGLDNVIVNETVNKHNLKYQSSSVPFPYESKEQYERALRMPIGEEWASRATHMKTILPSVTVKQGMVIDPMKAPFK